MTCMQALISSRQEDRWNSVYAYPQSCPFYTRQINSLSLLLAPEFLLPRVVPASSSLLSPLRSWPAVYHTLPAFLLIGLSPFLVPRCPPAQFLVTMSSWSTAIRSCAFQTCDCPMSTSLPYPTSAGGRWSNIAPSWRVETFLPPLQPDCGSWELQL
jgi:hypothetical protein